MKQIRHIDDLTIVANSVSHILTLFSGGLDSTFVLESLAKLPVKVTLMAVDLGDEMDREQLLGIAQHYGAELVVVNAREQFASGPVMQAIRAQAKYLGLYPVSSSLSRPVIAQHAVILAERLGCEAIIHTANQSQNSLRRLNGAIRQQGYSGYFGTPYEYSAISRAEKIAALSLPAHFDFSSRVVSGDSNLWCREFESGVLDNPEQFTIPEGLFTWTKQVANPPHLPVELELTFEAGVPCRLNGQSLRPLALLEELNVQIGAFGIGRYIGLEHLNEGEKVLEVREAPAACCLMDAYRHLETAVHDINLLREKTTQECLWTLEAVEGRWGSALHAASSAFIDHTASRVTGSVKYRLSTGNMMVESIMADNALYLTDRDAWEVKVAQVRSQRGLV